MVVRGMCGVSLRDEAWRWALGHVWAFGVSGQGSGEQGWGGLSMLGGGEKRLGKGVHRDGCGRGGGWRCSGGGGLCRSGETEINARLQLQLQWGLWAWGEVAQGRCAWRNITRGSTHATTDA